MSPKIWAHGIFQVNINGQSSFTNTRLLDVCMACTSCCTDNCIGVRLQMVLEACWCITSCRQRQKGITTNFTSRQAR